MYASTNTLSPSSYARPSLRSWCRESPSVAAPVFFFQSKDAPAWVGRNEDSLLREAFEKRLLVSATRGGSCAHPDQSRGLALRHKLRAISVSEHFLLILLFFLGGGVALHERLVGVGPALVLYRPMSLRTKRTEASASATMATARTPSISRRGRPCSSGVP